MYGVCNLKIVYEILNEMKFDLLCSKKFNDYDCENNCCGCYPKKCYLKEVVLIKNIASKILERNFRPKEICDCELEQNRKVCYISLLDVLLITLCDIEKCTCCKKNYGYLLQIDKFECILENFKDLLCQLKCATTRECDLIAQVLCTLFKIIDLIESIIAKINNIECLCKSCLCCEDAILECMICELEDEVNDLEKEVNYLSKIVLDIASAEILNCTTCGVSEYIKNEKINYLDEYCKTSQFNYEWDCDKKY